MNIKKFTNIVLKIAGVVAVAGAVCMLIAFAMGLTTDHFMQMLRDGRFALVIKDGYIVKYTEDLINGDGSNSIGLVTGESENETSDEWQFFLDEDCKSLDVDFGAGVLDIHYEDVEQVQIYHENIKQFNAKVENGVLKINTGHEVYIDDADNRQLVIVLPTDMKFDEVDLDIAAAMAHIDGIQAKEVSVSIGAGQANISNITTGSMEMEVGAGQAVVTALDAKEIKAECGMGQIDMEVTGAQTDYNCDVECGMGNVEVGHHGYGGVGTQHHGDNHEATKHIDVECGMGEVIVKFME